MKRIVLPLLLLIGLTLYSCTKPDNTGAMAQADEIFIAENQYLFEHYAVGDSVAFIRES